MMAPEDIGLRLDAAFRGGAIALVLLTAWRLVFAHRHSIAARFGAAFCAAIAVYIALSSSALHPLVRPWLVPAVLLTNQGSALLWLFATALFDDRFRWRWRMIVPSVAILVLTVVGLLVAAHWRLAAFLLYQAIVIVMLGAVLLLALRSLSIDLVDERRKFALALSVLVPITGLITAAAEIVAVWQPLHWSLSALQTISMFALAFLFAGWVAADGAAIFTVARQALPSASDVPAEFSPADRIELARIRALIAGGALFDHGACVAQLARLAAIPEHRLRRLVNRGMGYRNFRELVNDARIAEARTRLADPACAREQVLTLSWDLGYNSLAPFNRAFRERTGMSPTDYRKSALASAVLQSKPQVSEQN